jgi:hypothetical protein
MQKAYSQVRTDSQSGSNIAAKVRDCLHWKYRLKPAPDGCPAQDRWTQDVTR